MKNTLPLAALTLAALIASTGFAAEEAAPAAQNWSFKGVRADWNKDEIYRGYTVATQVCMSCHSFKYINHRDLMRVGFTENEVKKLAAALHKGVDDPLTTGLTDADAKSLYGKVPPDLTLMNRAREHGADYTYAVLTGFSDKPADIAKHFPGGLPKGAYFNHAFPGHAIAMPPPLTGPDLVSYHDATSATVPQMAHDVATFMQWTSEPERVERQRLGVHVLIYLLVFCLLAYGVKRIIWRDVH